MIGAAVQGLMAFNLICTGTTYIGATRLDALKKENQLPYAQTFRIDLNERRWCSGKCETTSPIYNIGATTIMLKLEQDKEANTESFISINREDGKVLDRTIVDTMLIMNTGQCERAPFTGFPALKF